MTTQVGIYLFPDVEVLDFAGPYEVFTTASRVAARLTSEAKPPFATGLIAAQLGGVRARAGLVVQPDYTLAAHPALDVLIIPGGVVTGEMTHEAALQWIREISQRTQLTASVCTGVFLLAQAGVLTHQTVTTHWEDLEELRMQFPGLHVVEQRRWIDEGRYITSAGISAGIDMSLHIVERMAGRALAEATAKQMEFDWCGV